MSVDSPPSLLSLFVFNPSLGNEDTESAKLLYFYPPSTSLNSQKDAVGLVEAICGFSAQLVGDAGAESVRGDEELHTVLQCEPGYYIVCVTKHSSTLHKAGKGGGGASVGRVEWHEEAVDERAVRSQLRLAHSAFRTLNGGFAQCAASQSMDGLRARLDLFFRFWLPSIPFHRLHLSCSALQGYAYLPVDAITYLTIQLLANNIKANFPSVAALAFLHDGRLVYTDVQGADMEALYALAADSSRASMQSYLAINEELTQRLSEAAGTNGSHASSNGGNSALRESSESDIFLLPRSMYEVMAVKKYQGEQYSEGTQADFMAHTAAAQQQPQRDRREQPAAAAGSSKQRDRKAKRADGAASASSSSAPGLSSSPAGAGTATLSAVSLPVGFLTGPYRSPLPAVSLPYTSGAWSSLNSPMWSAPLPLTLEDRACVDSPRLFLQPGWKGEADDARQQPAEVGAEQGRLHRLLLYRRHAITLLFVVACESGSPSSNSPPLSLYDTLESFMHSTLKKVNALLSSATQPHSAAHSQNQTAPHSASAATGSSSVSHPSSASSLSHPSSPGQSVALSSPSSASASASSDYRFLYYNSCNLVLAQTLDPHSVRAGCVGAVRECQAALQRRAAGCGSGSGNTNSSSSHECVLRMRSGGWVAGKRAAATGRHFVALFDERLGSLSEVQREMEQLTRSLFHNVCFQ